MTSASAQIVTIQLIDSTSISQHITQEELTNDILQNRVSQGDIEYSEYNGLKFNSDEALDEYLLTNNKVEEVYTSSNPSKIIKNYEHMTLDSDKVYNIDINNTQQLYRDAYGNVAFSKQEALDTYTNKNMVNAEYSYDGAHWFRQPEEAKIYEKYNMDINKSIYYYWNNQYYNAFNQKDIDALISGFDEGYYVDFNKTLDGTSLVNPIHVTGDSKLTYDLLKQKLNKTVFTAKYLEQITDVPKTYTLSMTPKSEFEVSAQYFKKNVDGSMGELISDNNVYGANNKLTINIKYPDKFLTGNQASTWNQVLTWFTDRSQWVEAYHENWMDYTTHYYLENYFEGIYNGQPVWIKLHVNSTRRRNSEFDDWVYSPNIIVDYNIVDETTGHVNLFSDPSKIKPLDSTAERKGVYFINDITEEEWSKLYNSWFENYFLSTITNFNDHANDPVSFEYIKSQNYNIKNTLTNKLTNDEIGLVYKDKAYDVNYDKGYSVSLIETYQNWLVKKDGILNSPVIDEDGSTKYKLDGDFLATKEQLDKYLYLEGNFYSKVMYSYAPEPDTSDRDGLMLAETLEEAKEKELINQDKTLRVRYTAYDSFNNEITSNDSLEDAVEQLSNKIQLTSKFVNKNEVESFNKSLKISWDAIVSDGRYVVYKVKQPNSDDYLYYPTQELALNALKADASINSAVNKKIRTLYVFKYLSTSGQSASFTFYDNDIEYVIRRIFELEHWDLET